MQSVSIDCFRMPSARYHSQMFDTIALCVDRHSGWMIAAPLSDKGKNGAKVEEEFFRRGWDFFGLPSVITSDNDALWVGAWWKTMCAKLGVQHAISQPYHHRSNGRAECAGNQLMEKLRKIHVGRSSFTWVDALPAALRYIHDQPGSSGLSPYEILFGRERPLANLPFQPSRESPDAVDFMEHMAVIDKWVSQSLNGIHAKQAMHHNSKTHVKSPLHIGQKVLYRRPRESHHVFYKVEVRWIGPCPVVGRTSASSYVVEIKPGKNIAAHRDDLLEWKEDVDIVPATPLWTYMPEQERLEIDEWEVDKITRHRKEKDGSYRFLTLWKGFSPESATWEPIESFFHRYSSDFVDYYQQHKLSLDIPSHLSPLPSVPSP
jgi:hypothetical protein